MSTPYRRDEHARSAARMELLNEFISLCEAGEVAGFAIYGEFDPLTDKRCLSREAIEEIRDCWNYMKFLELKRPDLRSPVQEVRAKLAILYGKLKKLEVAERSK